jgi:hypothetical protein
VDAKIEQRLEHLARAEQNLRLLFDSLRSQVLQAHPLIAQLNQLRAGNAELIECLVDQVRARMDPSIPGDTPPTAALAIDTTAAEEQLRQTAHEAAEALNARTRQAETDLHATVDSARDYINQAFASSRQQTDAILGSMHQRLDEMRAMMSEARQMSAMLTTAMTPPAELTHALVSARGQLDAVVGDFNAHADATLDAIRRSVGQQVELLAQQGNLVVRPLLAKITEQKNAAEAQLATAAQGAEEALASRAEELRRGAERMVEMMERQLIDRLTTLRPRTRAALESIEHAAAQRMTQAMDELTASMARTEERLNERLESLRPRAVELAKQLDKDLKEQLKRLEDDAIAGVHWLEHRLTRRVEELTSRLAREIDGQIDQTDARLDATAGNTGRHSAPAVEMQVMVDGRLRSVGSDAHAA